MIKVTSNISETAVHLGAWASKVGGAGRRNLFSAAANAVSILVRSHLSKLGSWKHESAALLSAQPTGFLQKAARGTVHHANDTGGEVVIPAPLGRAFHDVEIRPNNWQYLTIPASAEAYGKRAKVLKGIGWRLYMPPGKRFITGYKKGVGSKILYWLHESVKQEQDRELLPSDDEMYRVASGAMMAEIRRIAS